MTSKKNFKLNYSGEIRTRFAPSPTGFFHIGGARTALFNYIFAKQNNGSFILRIEDTDKDRSLVEFENDILKSLKWLGLDWSEGPIVGGKYGPYKQSERLEIYRNYINKLIKENKAYYCFCTPEELETQKQYLASQGKPWTYIGKCANLSKSEVKENFRKNKKFVVRFKNPGGRVFFEDVVRGKIQFDSKLLGDFSIAKGEISEKDIYPLYNLAVVVDDYEMRISHVIRGEDHLSNTPKQILLIQAFGFYKPVYVHLPLILGPDKSKLSKRHGAMPVSKYMSLGYLPEALINFIAFLGWNPGTNKEIYSLDELLKDFSLEKIQKGGAIFNNDRLDFLNSFYIKKSNPQKLAECSLLYFKNNGISLNYLERVISVYQTRIKKLSDILTLCDFFFVDQINYPPELLFWKNTSKEELISVLNKLYEEFSIIDEINWREDVLQKVLINESGRVGDKGKVFWPFRVALSGKKNSAGPVEIALVLGKEKVLSRIKFALKQINST
jgi:glutamyl-tRNA synthetase